MKKLFLFALSLTIGLLFCLGVGAQTSVTITNADVSAAGVNGSISKNLDLHGSVTINAGLTDKVKTPTNSWFSISFPCTLQTGIIPEFQSDFELLMISYDSGGDPTNTIHIYIHINTVTSVNDISDNVNFTIYPNPTTDFININSDKVDTYEVIDITGKSLIKTSDKTINVSELKTGQYFLRVGNSTKVFIKN